MASQSPIKSGARFGRWELIEQIGSGGNGVVWKAKNQEGRLGAIKFLRRQRKFDVQRHQRFKDEVQTMQACADIPGVLPLLDFSIPDTPRPEEVAWLVSAYATPLAQRLPDDESLESVVGLCASLAETLHLMHERDYSHRDIKPENIFWYESGWCLGDFGIADFPDKDALTKEGEKLGPLYYIAPEMLNDASHSDGSYADVYSLAKLLWKLATGQRYPMPGIQSANEPSLTISAYVRKPLAHTLDRLLEAATQVDPRRRPRMKDFARALLQWLEPPPNPIGPTDLTPYSKRILALTQPYRHQIQRRADIQARADTERGRVFKLFSSTLSDIQIALEESGIGDVAIAAPAGGNGAFYHAVTGNQVVGRGDRTWLFQFSVSAVLRDDRRRVTLMAGVNLGVKNIEDDPDPLHDIYAPVLAAAGYILTVAVFGGRNWEESSQLLWGESDSFLFGQPSEVAVTDRFNAGLLSNLKHAVEAFLDAFEAAGNSEASALRKT